MPERASGFQQHPQGELLCVFFSNERQAVTEKEYQ
jgi:hypothetical protein